jgi:HSP20 family molecular chaperone IbpA
VDELTRRSDIGERMWAEAAELLGQAERLHRQFFRLAVSAPAAWEPPADVFADERELVIVVAMPGVPAEQVQVVQDAGALIVRGTRVLPLAHSGLRVRQLEIPYGAFERRLSLPAGRFELAAPELAHGCLTLRLRRLEDRP